MFVRKSTLEKVQLELDQTLKLYRKRDSDYEDLVRYINRKGGQDWLNRAVLPETVKPPAPQIQSQFSQDEIKRLLLLCHPDKHDGKQMAVELTKKLLKLRK